MSNMVQIIVNGNKHNLGIKEYRNKKVVTFKDIDTLHSRPEGTASRNFREHRERFIKKEDYFEVTQPDEMRRLGFERPQGGMPEKLILITESGYLILVKSFTDDLAWQVQRQLVNTYFRAKETKSIHPDTILKHKLLLSKQLAQGRPQGVLQKLQVEAVLQTQEETGFDYSRTLAILESKNRLETKETTATVTLQPLFDYLNANPDVGVLYDGYLYIKAKDFRKILNKLSMNYFDIAHELDKTDMIKSRFDYGKRHFTSRVPAVISKRKDRDYYVAIKYTLA